MALDEETISRRVEEVMQLVIGLPLVEAMTVLASSAGLVLKAAGAGVPIAEKLANRLLAAIPPGNLRKTLVNESRG